MKRIYYCKLVDNGLDDKLSLVPEIFYDYIGEYEHFIKGMCAESFIIEGSGEIEEGITEDYYLPSVFYGIKEPIYKNFASITPEIMTRHFILWEGWEKGKVTYYNKYDAERILDLRENYKFYIRFGKIGQLIT